MMSINIYDSVQLPAERGPRAQQRFHGVNSIVAGSAKRIPVSLRRREAARDSHRADREGDACDLRRTRVPGAAIDRETVDAYREIRDCKVPASDATKLDRT